MANPPFNVDEVELDGVKDQARFNTYGVPQNKTKNKKKDAKETVPNANYLWINQFATALNENGRAALVMANSASDAGNSEKDIRIKLVESGVISQMVTLPSNMFTSVTLPATLWFFDKQKQTERKFFLLMPEIFLRKLTAHTVNFRMNKFATSVLSQGCMRERQKNLRHYLLITGRNWPKRRKCPMMKILCRKAIGNPILTG